ncbi:MAG: hypothetical protein ACLVKO_07425 [Dysgonomonas sp.]
MKQLTAKIAIITLSFVICLTGMGATVANFCCDNCVNQFIYGEHFSGDSADTHDANTDCCGKSRHSDAKKGMCGHLGDHKQERKPDCCKIERHSVDLDFFYHKVSFPAQTWVAAPLSAGYDWFANETKPVDFTVSTKDPPKIRQPKDYRAIIQIFII